MKLKAASDHYTDAMVDLGLAKTIQLSELVESGFERLENQVRRGLVAGFGNAAGMIPRSLLQIFPLVPSFLFPEFLSPEQIDINSFATSSVI